MATFSVNWSAPVSPLAGTVLAGQVLIPDGNGLYVVATTANRALYGRADGIAMTAGDASNPCALIEAGPIENTLTGLGVGLASWVRVSALGVCERITTPVVGNDVIGWCETTGRLHSVFGTLTAAIVNGGSAFTPPTGTGLVTVTGGVLDAASTALGAGIAAFLTTPSGANLATALTSALTAAKGGTGLTSLGTNVATLLGTALATGFTTFAGTPTGANLASLLTTALPVSKGGTNYTALVQAIAALAIDWSLAPTFTKTLSAGANTFTWSNQVAGMVIVVRVTGAASTLTWPTVKWAAGAAPTQTASGTDVYTFFYDGTNTYGSVVQAMA